MGTQTNEKIIPAYLVREGDGLSEMFEDRLRFLGKTRLNHLLRCISKPRNGLFELLCPHLYVRDRDYYVDLDDQVWRPGRTHEFLQPLIESGLDFSEFQERAEYFCNAMRFPVLNGLKLSRNGQEVEDWRPLPSERPTNCGLYVQTIEYDPEQVEIREFLDKQIGWCLGEEPLCDRIFDSMCRYRDFRLLEVVWSGHKSCHFHFVFDTRHLASTRFAGSRELTPCAGIPDIPDEALRTGFAAAWNQLSTEIGTLLGVCIDSDPSLRFSEWFRRLGWGQRRVKPDDRLGFEVGTRIPQVVLYSRGRRYARTASEWLHHPERFLEAARKQSVSRRKPTRAPTLKTLSDSQARAFIEELASHCEIHWGDPQTHPRPHQLHEDGQGYKVTFYNNADDATPSSVMRGEYPTLLIQGKPRAGMRESYRLPFSLDEMIEYWLENGHLIPERVASEPASWIEESYRDLIAANPGRERQYLPRSIYKAAMSQRLTAILSQEGAGKTTALQIFLPLECRSDEGEVVFASKSYRQAQEKCQEFNTNVALHRNSWRGVLLPSFHRIYEQVAGELQQPILSLRDVVERGQPSLIEAVYAEGGEIANRIEQVRGEFLRECEASLTILFTVHSVAHQWYRRGVGRFWLHPLFHEWRELRRSGDHDRARKLADRMYEQMCFGWLVHDEIGTDDLLSKHPEGVVEWAWALRDNLGDAWENVPLGEKIEAFDQMLAQRPCSGMSFDICQNILEAEYVRDDLLVVNPDIDPFGTNNKPDSPYIRFKGERWYAKARDWWSRNRFRITVLTTERKPFAALRAIGDKAIAAAPDRKEFQPTETSEVREAIWGPDRGPRGNIAPRPIFNEVFGLFNFDTSDLMPEHQMRIQLILNPLARRGKENLPDVVKLCKKIREDEPDTVIACDIVTPEDVPGVINHSTARGSNEYTGRRLTGVFLYLAPELYRDLLLEDALFATHDAVKLHYIDVFDQTFGRTLGFRYGPDSKAKAILSPKLWREIGTWLLTESRYRLLVS